MMNIISMWKHTYNRGESKDKVIDKFIEHMMYPIKSMY